MSVPIPEISLAVWAECASAGAVGLWLGRIFESSLLPALAAKAGYRSLPFRSDRPRTRFIEAATAGAFLACCLLYPPAKALAGCVFFSGLIGATVIDRDHMIIPDLFTVGLAAAGLALSLVVPALHDQAPFLLLPCLRSLAASLLGLIVGSAIALWIGVIAEIVLGREALGFGDVKLLGAIGAFCGWRGAVFALFGGATIGALACSLAAARRGAERMLSTRGLLSNETVNGRVNLHAPFPFGPMLASAAALYFLFFHAEADRWLSQYLLFF